jgi:tellurite resistance protein TehA-like permease
MAVAALVLGIIAIPACLLAFFDAVFVVLALVFGIVVLRTQRPGRGLATAGIACALVGAVLATLVTVALNHRIEQCGGWGHLGDPGFQTCLNNE